jgi:hypothetical protein
LILFENTDIGLAVSFGQVTCSLEENCRAVCLGYEDDAENAYLSRQISFRGAAYFSWTETPRTRTNYADGYTADSLYPSPSDILRDEAANDGTQDGTKKRGDGVQCQGETPLGGREYIGEGTARVYNGGATKSAGEESQDDESGNVLASS